MTVVQKTDMAKVFDVVNYSINSYNGLKGVSNARPFYCVFWGH